MRNYKALQMPCFVARVSLTSSLTLRPLSADRSTSRAILAWKSVSEDTSIMRHLLSPSGRKIPARSVRGKSGRRGGDQESPPPVCTGSEVFLRSQTIAPHRKNSCTLPPAGFEPAAYGLGKQSSRFSLFLYLTLLLLVFSTKKPCFSRPTAQSL